MANYEDTLIVHMSVAAPFEPIGVGDKIPNGELTYLDDDGKLQAHCIYDLVRDKRVVFFGVPGAFTPTCRYASFCIPSYCTYRIQQHQTDQSI